MTRPTILFVGINYRYINATNLYIPAALSLAFACHFYGPGFVSDQVLSKGIDSFVDSIGGIDLIFATKDFCADIEPERLARFMRRHTVMLNGGRVSSAVCTDVSGFLRRNRERTVALLTDLDPHSVPQYMIDRIRAHAGYYAGWGEQFLDTLADAEWVATEEYVQKKLRAGYTLGLLDKFAAEERRRVISTGFYVAESEFYWGALANRPFDVAVPGASYTRRKQFADAMAGTAGVRAARFPHKRVYQIAQRVGIRPFARFYWLSVFNIVFQRTLSRSKSCVTDGGATNYPVRKFFEIPAAGAVLVCPPAVGMEHLGFVDGKHYISVRTVAQAVEAVRAIASAPEDYQSVATAGRNLVLARHSLSARSGQWSQAVARILDGTFEGTSWEAGEFRCRVSAPAAVRGEPAAP